MDEKVKLFIEDIETVCKKHNMSISHEDEHGAFIIKSFNQGNIDWLKDAFDRREGITLCSYGKNPASDPHPCPFQ